METFESLPLARLQVSELNRNIKEIVWRLSGPTNDGTRAHYRSIYSKLHQDLGVDSIWRILRKDYDYAMRAVSSYPGFGRNWPVESAE